ncbi:MAG: M23 family metallopeptidase [Flavobacteriaceae bacterium]
MQHASILLAVLFSLALHAQNDADPYHIPVDIPVFLSGTFGELRGSHFHAGIDIKTQGREGIPIRAVKEGYVARIKVATSGYGKVLYVAHPDGNTSVYAHLRNFSPKITALVRQKQYEKKSFPVELFLDPETLPIETKEVIAYSGNTGGSLGPHLHFELRETDTQMPINPLLGFYEVTDTTRPVIHTLMGYPADTAAVINGMKKPIQIPLKKLNDSIYIAEKIQAIGKIGFGIGIYDHANGSKVHEIKFEKFRFSDSEHIHALIDYPRYSKTRSKVQKLFRDAGNELPFFDAVESGLLQIEADKDYAYRIRAADANGNTRFVFVAIKGIEQEVVVSTEKETPGKIIYTDRDYLFRYEDAEVYLTKNCFFDEHKLDIRFEEDSLHVEKAHIPVRKPIRIRIKTPDSIHGHYLGIRNAKNEIQFLSAQQKDGFFEARVKQTGVFAIAQDTIAPTIVPVGKYNNQWLSNFRSLRFKISDNQTGIKFYTATIDGKWALFEHEPKKDEITFWFDDYFLLEDTKHLLEINVKDQVGNTTTHNLTFYRKK